MMTRDSFAPPAAPLPHHQRGLDETTAWAAVLAHDSRFDGHFVYAVKSTRIYCRPSCPSRRPARDRAALFFGRDACQRAEDAGYRACLRCQPRRSDDARSGTADIVRRARALLDARDGERITLSALATAIGTGRTRLQRAFTSTLGVSPREYQETKRMERLRRSLRAGHTVSEATYDAGFAGPRRVYERAAAALGMTPATFRRGGAGIEVRYGIIATTLGKLLVAATARGVCAITIGDDDDALIEALRAELPKAELALDHEAVSPWLEAAARLADGSPRASDKELALDVDGTAFQQKVWRELQRIPAGSTRTYTEVAAAIGQPTAVRAVARACASNRLALAIPCHRVIRGDGTLGGYRWGMARKQALLQRERGPAAQSGRDSERG